CRRQRRSDRRLQSVACPLDRRWLHRIATFRPVGWADQAVLAAGQTTVAAVRIAVAGTVAAGTVAAAAAVARRAAVVAAVAVAVDPQAAARISGYSRTAIADY